MQDFRDLKAWEKAHQLTLRVYSVTRRFPAAERYGLTSQMRRGAAPIGANIAEGCCRDAGADFARFLRIALSSASELEYHILLARDLQFFATQTGADLLSEVAEVKRMLTVLLRRVREAVRPAASED